nr:ATP-binding protein [Acidobacteriota bacterium]
IQADKLHNIPINIPGFSINDFNDPISKVRDIVKTHISPVPAILPQLISISQDNYVLVIYIPGEQDKPFITSDGRIYRRTADTSDPVSEKDRYSIDRLYDEGKKFRKRFAEFSSEELNPNNLDHKGWLTLFIAPYPAIINNDNHFETENVEKLLEKSQVPMDIPYYDETFHANLPFDVGYATFRSIVLKQVMNNRVDVNAMSSEFLGDGWAKFEIPLPFTYNFQLNGIENVKSEKLKAALKKRLNERFIHSPEILHLLHIGKLTISLANLITFYLEWLGEEAENLLTEYRFAAKLYDVQRAVPFFDGDELGEFIEKFGLPVNMKESINIKPNADGWYRWETKQKIPLWQVIALLISYAFGLTENLLSHAMAKTMNSQ